MPDKHEHGQLVTPIEFGHYVYASRTFRKGLSAVTMPFYTDHIFLYGTERLASHF